MKVIFFLLLVLTIGLKTFGQQMALDSLDKELLKERNDSLRIKIVDNQLKICETKDNLIYSKKIIEIAEKNIVKHLNTNYFLKYKAVGLNGLGYYYDFINDNNESIKHYSESITILTDLKDSLSVYIPIVNLFNCYKKLGMKKEAILNAYKVLEISKSIYSYNINFYIQDIYYIANYLNSIGEQNKAMDLYKEGIELSRILYYSKTEHYKAGATNSFALYYKIAEQNMEEISRGKEIHIIDSALFYLNEIYIDSKNTYDYAQSLTGLGDLYIVMGNYSKAEPLYLQAMQIIKNTLGENHTGYAKTLNCLAKLYQDMENYAKAEPLFLQLIEIDKNNLGENDPDYANSLTSLGNLYKVMGYYSKAEPLYLQAMEIIKNTLGETHPDYPNSLNCLAALYQDMGNYAKAEPLCLQAVEIIKKSLGETHPDYANSLYGLAILYRAMGNYAKAEPLFLQLIEIDKNNLGENDPDYAQSLTGLGNLYKVMGYYSKAEPLYIHAMEIIKNTLGENHTGYANTLNSLAALYQDMGNYAKAEPLYLQALKIRNNILGEDHPDYANSLNNLANLYQAMGNYAKAEPLLLQSIEIRKKSLGENHPYYANALNNLGSLYSDMGNYNKAEPLYLQAMEFRKKSLGENHPDYATSLNNLASLYKHMGNYVKAEPLLLLVIEISKKSLGEIHPDYATYINNLAIFYEDMGKYVKAEPLLLQALEINKNALGENHPEYAASLTNLAGLYYYIGNYTKAEKLFLQATEIHKKVLGEIHPDYATSLNNLAVFYSEMGNYTKVEQLYLQALEINKNALGENHLDYAISLDNLAVFYEVEMRNYTKSEQLKLQALEIKKNTLGETHSYYANSLNNLAFLYCNMGNYSKAEPLYLKALEIRKNALGETHPDYARSLNNLAGLYEDMSEFSKAEPLYIQSLEIKKKSLGITHPDYANALYNLADLYNDMSNYVKAELLLIEGLEISLQNINQYFSFLSEKEKELYLKTIEYKFERFNEFAIKRKEQNYFITNNVYDNLLKTKGILLKSGTAMRSAVLSSKDEKLITTYEKWNTIKKRIVNLYNLPIDNRKEDLATLVNEANVLEKDLTRKSSVISDFNTFVNINWKNIQTQLKANEAAIEFTNFRIEYDTLFGRIGSFVTQKGDYIMLQPEPGSPSEKAGILNGDVITSIDGISIKGKTVSELGPLLMGNANTSLKVMVEREGKVRPFEVAILRNETKIKKDSILYCVLLIKKDSKYPEMIPLFEENQITPLLTSIAAERGIELLGEKENVNFGRDLYKLVWKPLEGYLQGINKIYYSPSGLLNKVSFASLEDTSGTMLIDRFELHQLQSTADIEEIKKNKFNLPNSIALFGGANYNLSADSMHAQAIGLSKPADIQLTAKRTLPSSTNTNWTYLPGTLTEVNAIKKTFTNSKLIQTYSSNTATEDQLKSLCGFSSPKIIHIATHGYYIPELKRKEKIDFIPIGNGAQFTSSVNPLLRTGLILAGANNKWVNNIEIDGADDGILTALEISNLNFLNTDLVVLSACETGLGDINGSEGVYGLQRAFRLAGVKRMIVSLWQVPDSETAEMMEYFYSSLMNEKKGYYDAFRAAQNKMKQKYPFSPIKWAGFVLIGE